MLNPSMISYRLSLKKKKKKQQQQKGDSVLMCNFCVIKKINISVK